METNSKSALLGINNKIKTQTIIIEKISNGYILYPQYSIISEKEFAKTVDEIPKIITKIFEKK